MSTVVVVVVEELRHNMEKQEVHTVEVLVPMRNLCGSPTRVVCTAIRCISWGNTAEGCTHPRVSIVPHGPIWVWISSQGLLILPWKVSIIPH